MFDNSTDIKSSIENSLNKEKEQQKNLFDTLTLNDERRKNQSFKQYFDEKLIAKGFQTLAGLRRGVDYVHHVKINTVDGEIEIPMRLLSIKEQIEIDIYVRREFQKHPEYVIQGINPLFQYMVMVKTLAQATSTHPGAKEEEWLLTEDDILGLNEEGFKLFWKEYSHLEARYNAELNPEVEEEVIDIIEKLVDGGIFQTKKSKLTYIHMLTYSQLSTIVMKLSDSLIELADSIRFGSQEDTTNQE